MSIRTAHARYFAGRETDVCPCGTAPDSVTSYDWFTLELANLRAAFRWAADHGDLDTATAIAHYAAFVGFWVEQYEPIRGPRNSSNPRAPSSTES